VKFTANIDYPETPTALIEYGGKTYDIYPFLPEKTQKKINKEYNLEIEIKVPDKLLREIFPVEWANNNNLKLFIQTLPPHITNKYNIPQYTGRRGIGFYESVIAAMEGAL